MTEMKDTQLLPVLAAHTQATEELTDRLFPSIGYRSMSVTNHAGWSAGRAAADLALFVIVQPYLNFWCVGVDLFCSRDCVSKEISRLLLISWW